MYFYENIKILFVSIHSMYSCRPIKFQIDLILIMSKLPYFWIISRYFFSLEIKDASYTAKAMHLH